MAMHSTGDECTHHQVPLCNVSIARVSRVRDLLTVLIDNGCMLPNFVPNRTAILPRSYPSDGRDRMIYAAIQKTTFHIQSLPFKLPVAR